MLLYLDNFTQNKHVLNLGLKKSDKKPQHRIQFHFTEHRSVMK